MAERITVLLVDDHRVVREGVRVFLSTQPDVLVVGEAEAGAEAVALAAQYVPDVALVDLVMPGAAQLVAERPDQVATLRRRDERCDPPRARRPRLHVGDGSDRAPCASQAPGAPGARAAWLAHGAARRAVRLRPVLSVQYAGALLSAGKLAGVEPRLPGGAERA
jgi:CheY-like chemotaxis protein